MLVFEERGKPEYPGKNLLEQVIELTTNSTPHIPLKAELACVVGVRKERGRELGRETTREGGAASSRALSRFSRA